MKLRDFLKKVAAKFGATTSKNSAQRLLVSWIEVRPRHKPTRPHRVLVLVGDPYPHLTREGEQCFRRNKQPPKGDGKPVPTMCRYAGIIDRSKKYPYSSTRQNTRHEREIDRARAFEACPVAAA